MTPGMTRTCIAIVDASRARLFTLERNAEPEGLREQLTEVADLVNPARRLRPSELFSDSGTSSSRNGNSGATFDDHRAAHLDRLDAEFARDIAKELTPLAASVSHLVICASPHMLGALREVTAPMHRAGLQTDELARDLVKLTAIQIREHLATDGLLPPVVAREVQARH
jgi:protein required for attachment to host cells